MQYYLPNLNLDMSFPSHISYFLHNSLETLIICRRRYSQMHSRPEVEGQCGRNSSCINLRLFLVRPVSNDSHVHVLSTHNLQNSIRTTYTSILYHISYHYIIYHDDYIHFLLCLNIIVALLLSSENKARRC